MQYGQRDAHWTKLIKLPSLPPSLFTVLLTPCDAPPIAEPADDVTLERPDEALDVMFEAVSFPFSAVLETAWVASEVVEACRRAVRRATTRLCRSINRDGADDISPGGRFVTRTMCQSMESDKKRVGGALL